MRERAARPLSVPGLCLSALLTLGAALGLSACVNVASYTPPSLVRVIDASYIAPAVNINVENIAIASNIGQGAITVYGSLPASTNAVIKVTAATGGKALVTTNGTLLAGARHTVLLSDNGAAPNSYEVTVLEDQQVAAAGGHSAFRFLNQAPKTGAVDVYMVPAGGTLANTIPIVTDLAVGATAGYISFSSQTVTMIIVPTGTITPKYTSASLALTGGEVRTVLLVDTQLTSNPPIQIFMADDVN
jgi:hypothetical protein